jgi:PAS domain S-box-containing protein
VNSRAAKLVGVRGKQPASLRRLKEFGLILAIAAAYFGAGELTLRLDTLPTGVAAFWPASGIALAALILLGYRFWPGVLIGSLALGATLPGNPLSNLSIAIGHVFEGLAAAYLVNKYARGTKAFDMAQTVFQFVLFACILAPGISATAGTGSFYLLGLAGRSELANLWLAWWLANACGILLVAPFFIILFDRRHHRLEAREILELTCLVLSLIAIAVLAFGPLSHTMNKNQFVRAWMAIPILIWAAFRFCQLEVAGLIILLFGMAVSGTAQGYGYFVGPDFHVSLLNLDAFIGVIGPMSLAIAALVSERRGAITKLLGIQSLLQEAVAGKERDLTATVEALHMEVVEHLESAKALRASLERLRLQMHETSDVFWVFDANTKKVLYVSPAYETLWGRSCESLYADPDSWMDAVHPEDHGVAVRIGEQESEEDTFEAEYRIIWPDGSLRWVRDRGVVVRDRTGRICCSAGVASEFKGSPNLAGSVLTAQVEEAERNLL